jgi:hypothetical protein
LTFALPAGVAWLLIGTAAAIAIAVFVVRPRSRRHVVPSLAVWHRVLDQARGRTLWERVRWVVSAALTMLIAAAIAAAIARPAARTGDRSSGRALLVLDSSWSMRARTASGDTRWQRAVAEARAVARTSTAREIAIATSAEGVVEGPTADRARIDGALKRLAPSGDADGPWPRIADAGPTHFFTDGALARAMPPGVIVHSVFVPAANVALTAFDVEPAAAGTPGGAEVFVAVANFAANSQTVHLTVTRGADALLDRTLAIGAGGAHQEVMAIPTAGDARFHAHVTATHNALDIDDDAVAWLWNAEPLRVVVVGESSQIPALLAHDPSVRVTALDPARYREAEADVWVFDRWLPAAAPLQPALIIDPPASPWLGTRGTPEGQPAWRRPAPHPVLDGLDTALGRVGRTSAVVRPSLRTIAASEKDTPLVGIEDSAHGRYVVLGFSTQDAGFDSSPAFPVLVGNAIDWLGRPERGLHRQPGRVSLPAATRRVVAPNGRTLPLATFGDRVSTTLPAPGLYLAETAGGHRVLSVALHDPARSNLLASTVAENRSNLQSSGGDPRPWWLYCAAAALALASLEWVTWRRRVTV